jgi:PII-like signaling protein
VVVDSWTGALIDLYGRNDIAASIVLRGIQGFGLAHHPRTDGSLGLSEDLPMTAIAVTAGRTSKPCSTRPSS